jgi:hypothetical protein
MQGKSSAQSVEKWFDEVLVDLGIDEEDSKPQRVQSFLGGAFLRMYLDGKVDPTVVEQAGEEIAASETFKNLTDKVTKHLQAAEDHSARKILSAPDIEVLAKQRLTRIRRKSGIAFRQSLNTVIGGVTRVDVTSAAHLADTETSDGTVGRYRIDVVFADAYDFENKRYGEYDRYRKKLARYLIANEFDKFEEAYYREAQPLEGWHKTKLDSAGVFASFMYALEKRGWTPGPLVWDVTVPMEVSIIQRRATKN